MPKSKRAKVISLTKVKKKPKSAKDTLIEEVREAATKFKYALVVSVENERNTFLKEIRRKLGAGCRLFYGKNKLLQHALGTEAQRECEDGIHKVSNMISGHTGLLCTDAPVDKIRDCFAEYQPSDYARCGGLATETVVLPEGEEALSHMPHSIEAHLRQVGMPTQLKAGKILLLGKHTVCKEGQPLTSDQAQVLKLLGIKMAHFRMIVEAKWTKEGGKFETYNDDEEMQD